MPRLKNKWLEKEKEPIDAIPVSVVVPITPQYLNVEQASAYLSVTTWTIRRLIDNKELSCAKIGKRFIVNLSGQGKSGHAWSLQNRPYGMARDVVLIYPAFS